MNRIVLIVILIISLLAAACTGALHMSPGQVFAILLDRMGLHLSIPYTQGMKDVLLQIRLPRVCLGALVGSGLAIAGASLQGLFRNPLADPVLTGISSGASLAAVMVLVLFNAAAQAGAEGWTSKLSGYYLLNIATFVGACLSSILVFRLSRTRGKTLVAALLLAGLGMNALCNALTGLVTYSANNEQLRSVTFWLMGSLGAASWNTVLSLLPFIALPIALLPILARSLNAWSLGESEAMHLGFDVRRLKIGIILLTTLSVGAAVAVSGIIGFVGLIVPHILRTLTGSDFRRLLPDSALFGAALLVLADLFSRTILAPAELPIGIVTAVLGAPVFLLLLYRQKKTLYTQAA